MGVMSLAHWSVVLLVILILFGAGKLPQVMGDLGRGVRNFKKGLADTDDNINRTENTFVSNKNDNGVINMSPNNIHSDQ